MTHSTIAYIVGEHFIARPAGDPPHLIRHVVTARTTRLAHAVRAMYRSAARHPHRVYMVAQVLTDCDGYEADMCELMATLPTH